MDTEPSNIQCKFFTHSSHSSFILPKFCFTRKSFSKGLDAVTEQNRDNRVESLEQQPLQFFPLGCPSIASLLLVARCLWRYPWPPVLLPLRESPATRCSTIFLFLSTTFAISAVPSPTKFATSRHPPVRKATRCRGQE